MQFEDRFLQGLIGRRRRPILRWDTEILSDFRRQIFIGQVEHFSLIGDATTFELPVQLLKPVCGAFGVNVWMT